MILCISTEPSGNQMEIKMKHLIVASAITLAAATSTLAQENIAANNEICTNTDVAIGICVGLTAGAIIGASSVIGLPIVGTGAMAGSSLTWGMAMSQPFLWGSTIPAAITGAAFVGPIIAVPAFAVSCAISNYDKEWLFN